MYQRSYSIFIKLEDIFQLDQLDPCMTTSSLYHLFVVAIFMFYLIIQPCNGFSMSIEDKKRVLS